MDKLEEIYKNIIVQSDIPCPLCGNKLFIDDRELEEQFACKHCWHFFDTDLIRD